MLCPEVYNFAAPQTKTFTKLNLDSNSTQKILTLNNFYKTIIITLPDELTIPAEILDLALEDSEFYKLMNCPITSFLEGNFIENFVQKGRLYATTVEKDSLIDTCVCITPEKYLILHVSPYIYQSLGLERTQQSSSFFLIKINLLCKVSVQKAKKALNKLDTFTFFITWEPHDQKICPSSLAKYFFDQNIKISSTSQEFKTKMCTVSKIPSLDCEPSELVELIGMLALDGDLNPEHDYVSSYCLPESSNNLESSRISISIIKGFFTNSYLLKLNEALYKYVINRDLDGYWCALSFKGFSDSLWRSKYHTPSSFLSHDTTTTVFYSKDCRNAYSAGLLKYT